MTKLEPMQVAFFLAGKITHVIEFLYQKQMLVIWSKISDEILITITKVKVWWHDHSSYNNTITDMEILGFAPAALRLL